MSDVRHMVKEVSCYAARVFLSGAFLAAAVALANFVLAAVSRGKYPIPPCSPIATFYVVSIDFSIALILFVCLLPFLLSGRKVVKFLGTGLLAVAIWIYLLSWSVYFMTGNFMNLEGLRFLAVNFGQILQHLVQSSVPALMAFCVLCVFTALAVPVVRRGITRLDKRMQGVNMPAFACAAAVVFMAAIVLTSMRGVEFNVPLSKALPRFFSPGITMARDVLIAQGDIPPEMESNLRLRRDAQIPMAQYKMMAGTPTPNVPVIVLVVESLRNDVLKDGTVMPNLFALKQDSIAFGNTVAAANRTDASWPSIFSSNYPLRARTHYYYPSDIPFPKVFIYDVLKQYNYKTAVFSAQNENWGLIRNYMAGKNLDVYFDSNSTRMHQYIDARDDVFLRWVVRQRAAGKIDDAIIVNESLAWAGRAGSNFFLGLFFQRPHFPYTWPASYQPPFSVPKDGLNVLFSYYPQHMVPLMKMRYYNALSYVDKQIGRVVKFLKARGLYDRSLIIVTGDHGESFYEKSFCCHGNYLFNEEIVTEMLIKTPGGKYKGARQDLVHNIDIPPTICGLLNIKPHPAFQGIDILTSKPNPKRPLFASIYTNIADQDAIYLEGWKYIREYTNQEEFLFDLAQDPAEQVNLVETRPGVAASLRRQVLQWRRAQLKYYANLFLEKMQYPPKVESGGI